MELMLVLMLGCVALSIIFVGWQTSLHRRAVEHVMVVVRSGFQVTVEQVPVDERGKLPTTLPGGLPVVHKR